VASLEDHFGELPPGEAARLAALALLTHATWQGAQAQAGGQPQAPGKPGVPGRAQAAARQLSPEDVLRALCQVGLCVVDRPFCFGTGKLHCVRCHVAGCLCLGIYRLLLYGAESTSLLPAACMRTRVPAISSPADSLFEHGPMHS
jgi:hypothetical protein